jgi:hypothetical protein
MKTVIFTEHEIKWICDKAGIENPFPNWRVFPDDLKILMQAVFAINRENESIDLFTYGVLVELAGYPDKIFRYSNYASEVNALKDAIKYIIKESGE